MYFTALVFTDLILTPHILPLTNPHLLSRMAATKSAAVTKAKSASKAVLKGGKFTMKKKKVMTSATFRRPKTKITARKPKVTLYDPLFS